MSTEKRLPNLIVTENGAEKSAECAPETKSRPAPDDDPASMDGSYRYENAGVPTDGQLMDQLEAAFEKMNDGYVCVDLALRKRLAITLNEFMNPSVHAPWGDRARRKGAPEGRSDEYQAESINESTISSNS